MSSAIPGAAEGRAAQLELAGEPPPWDRFGLAYVGPPAARRTDPSTSHDAARGYLPDAEKQNAQIVAYLRGVGARGATYYEIAEGLRWEPVQVARRLAALRRAGLLYSFDGRAARLRLVRAGAGHRSCALHVAADAGRPVGSPPEAAQAPGA